MPVGFYELLQVPPDASPEKVRALPLTTRREVQLSAAVLDEVTP